MRRIVWRDSIVDLLLEIKPAAFASLRGLALTASIAAVTELATPNAALAQAAPSTGQGKAPTQNRAAAARTPQDARRTPAAGAAPKGANASPNGPSNVGGARNNPARPSAGKSATAEAPAAAPDPTVVAIDPAGLKGITPGVSTAEQLKTAWGPAKESKNGRGTVRHVYEMPGFKQVEVFEQGDKVAYIVVSFEQPFAPEEVAAQLRFVGLEPVVINDDAGKPLGQAYPERGVVFSFDPANAKPAVAQLLLEGINAEQFAVRAESRWRQRPEAAMKDIDEALHRDDKHHRAFYTRAQILATHGQPSAALMAVEQAMKLEAADPAYRVLQAKLLAETGRHAEAAAIVTGLIESPAISPHIAARAFCVQGDILANSPQRDLKAALKAHMQAIEKADAAVADAKGAARREAKQVLIEAHLAAAQDIAIGAWNKKETVIPKWLGKADEAADDYLKTEGGDGWLRFEMARRKLAIAASTQGRVDGTPYLRSLEAEAKSIAASTTDPLARSRLSWEYAQGLYDGMQDAHARGQAGLAARYGQLALKQLASVNPKPPENEYLLGQIYYRLGAEEAVFKNDHKAAIVWYAKAIPMLEKPLPGNCLTEFARQGEAFISMGVSYWQSGDRRRAVDLTGEGVHLVEQAVKDGLAEKGQLEVPYANLANMHRELGDKTSSQKFAELATRVKEGTRRK